jgi:N-acetylglucosamine kinase-like BadF-type ATPase
VGNPARIIQAEADVKREQAASQMGFSAYGVTQNDDPLSQAMRGLIDNAAGQEHRCAGWGWLLDGAGSAMDIGQEGLRLSLQMADGRLAETPLRRALWAALDLDPDDPGSAQRLKALVVAASFGPAGFARLAPVVDQQAATGEAEAIAVMERNAAALAAMAAGVARGLDLVGPAVCPMGGALTHLEQLRLPFTRHLEQVLPGSRLVTAASDACQGALAMAAALLAEPQPA